MDKTPLKIIFKTWLKRKYLFFSYTNLFILRLILDYAYGNIVSLLFEYQNFRNEPTFLSYSVSWLFLISLSPYIIKNFQNSNLSSYIMSILIITSLLPTTTLIAFNSFYSPLYVILMYVYWLLLLIFNLLVPKINLAKKNQLKSKIPYLLLTFLFVGCVLYTSGKYTGFRVHFGLMDVYDLRTEAREYQVSTLLGYIITAADNILPVLLVFFLLRKSWIFSVFISVIIFLNFGISAVKQVLFLLLFAWFAFFFVKTEKFFSSLINGAIILVIVSIAEFQIFGTYFFTGFVTYRIFFIPAKLHYVYYSFFSVNELDYFRQSILKYFLESPYKDGIQFMMGDEDIGDFTARANNGLFTDAYLNFGAFGVFVFPLIVVCILKTLDGASKGLNHKIIFIVTTAVSFVLLGVPFSTALLSSGILILTLFLYTLPRSTLSSNNF